MQANWICSLSDGQSISEKTLLERDPTRSAWLQFLDYLKENKDKKVTSIQLVINGFYYNTPSIANKKNTKFKNDINPDRLWCSKKSDCIFVGGYQRDDFYNISYRVGDYRHYMWVNLRTNDVSMEVISIYNKNREKNIELFYDEVVA